MDLPEPATVTIPWCPNCHRSRFGSDCVECHGPLVLQEFVHRGAYDTLLHRAEGALMEASATLLTLAPILEAHKYEPRDDGHVWTAWTRWGERALERIHAALAGEDDAANG